MREVAASRFRLPPDQADDLLQSFILRKVLHQNLLSLAAPARGKFRTFLLNAISNFVIDELRKQNAQKRLRSESSVPLEEAETSPRFREIPPSFCNEFELAFTRLTLREALKRMKRRCETKGRFVTWEVFESRIVRPALEDTEPEPYSELVERLRLESTTKATNLLMSSKRTFANLLREVVEEYSVDSDDADGELRNLRKILED